MKANGKQNAHEAISRPYRDLLNRKHKQFAKRSIGQREFSSPRVS